MFTRTKPKTNTDCDNLTKQLQQCARQTTHLQMKLLESKRTGGTRRKTRTRKRKGFFKS